MISANDVLDRLQNALNVDSDTDLAVEMKVKRPTLGSWRQRDSIPYAECINIAEQEGLSLDWVFTGEGEMHKVSKSGSTQQCNDDVVEIVEYDVRLSAGDGAFSDGYDLELYRHPFPIKWIRDKGLNPETLTLLRVSGDSMDDLLKHGDVVMVDTSRTTPSEAMPFAVRFCDDLLVKTVQRMGDGSIALVSRNKAYETIVISKNNPPEEFQIIGAVVWHAHSWI